METITIEKLQETKELLALLRFLFWQEPTRELLENFLHADVIEEENDINRGLNVMQKAVQNNQARLDEYVEELAVEFTRLFIGPTKPPAIPFASFYLSESKQLMGETTLEVRKKYLDAGMAVKNLHSTPDDHIAIELEFLAWLAQEEEEARNRGALNEATSLQQTRDSFLADHIKPWATTFAGKILDNTQQEFYKGVALVLQGVAE